MTHAVRNANFCLIYMKIFFKDFQVLLKIIEIQVHIQIHLQIHIQIQIQIQRTKFSKMFKLSVVSKLKVPKVLRTVKWLKMHYS